MRWPEPGRSLRQDVTVGDQWRTMRTPGCCRRVVDEAGPARSMTIALAGQAAWQAPARRVSKAAANCAARRTAVGTDATTDAIVA